MAAFMYMALWDVPHLRARQTPQGKVAELRLELNAGRKDKNYAQRKIALKKIVANLAWANNEMLALFPDIVECMSIASLEIKKMCVSHWSERRLSG